MLRFGPIRLRAGWLPTAATVALLALLCTLGSWQLGRASFKERLESDFEQRAGDAPIRLSAQLDRAETLRHRPVMAKGVYLAERQLLLDNQVHRGVAGYHVLTPLRLSDENAAVLVNRGWLPVGSSRAQLPPLPVTAQPTEVSGIVHVPGPGPLLLGESGYEAGGWPRVVQLIDLGAAARLIGQPLLPYVVRLDPEATDGFTREWQAHTSIPPARHRAYAFQWFSLAAALAVIYVAVNARIDADD